MAADTTKGSQSLTDVHGSIKGAVVTVETPDGHGSGFAVRADGIVATNQHVIAGHAVVRVKFIDGNDTRARVLQYFSDVDLAFLLVEEPFQQVLSLHDGEQLLVGQEVFAVGNPFSLGHTLTKGIISAVNRPIDGVPWLQTDTAINPGNSGGPLCNLNGQVVGMATWRGKSDDPNTPVEGLNFALPVSIIKTKLSQLPEGDTLLETLHCPVCGSANKKRRYCEKCGATLDRSVEEDVNSSDEQILLEVCSVCQTKARRGQRHCAHCGASLELSLLRTCRVCQTQAREGQRYCGHCGASLMPEADED